MFKFIDRKQSRNLVLIGGWAFDYRIFEMMDLPYNYFFYIDESQGDFETELKQLLTKNHFEKISLFGWSQGAFVACDFASSSPDIIEDVILVGLHKKYERKNLHQIKEYLSKNKKAFLYKFYRDCFCREEEKHYLWFEKNLLKDYLATMQSDQLVKGLDALAQYQIRLESLNKIKCIKIAHGREDAIAPESDAIDIANSLPQADFISFERTGHLPFLRQDFKKHLY